MELYLYPNKLILNLKQHKLKAHVTHLIYQVPWHSKSEYWSLTLRIRWLTESFSCCHRHDRKVSFCISTVWQKFKIESLLNIYTFFAITKSNNPKSHHHKLVLWCDMVQSYPQSLWVGGLVCSVVLFGHDVETLRSQAWGEPITHFGAALSRGCGKLATVGLPVQ